LFLGLGLPQWLTIIGLVGGLLLTFKIMARASLAYAKAREERERRALLDSSGDVGASETRGNTDRELNEGDEV
jgi:hypothetical protein